MLPSYVIGLLALLFLGFSDSRLEARERFIEIKNINWQNISFSGLYTEFTETDTNDVYKIHIRIQNSEVLKLNRSLILQRCTSSRDLGFRAGKSVGLGSRNGSEPA